MQVQTVYFKHSNAEGLKFTANKYIINKNINKYKFINILAGLPGVARAFTTLKYYVYAHPTPPPNPPVYPPNLLTHPRPVPGRPRPTCKVSALYLENCANALRQTETETETILFKI